MHVHSHSGIYTDPVSVFQRFGYVVIVVHALNIHPVADNKTVKLPLIA